MLWCNSRSRELFADPLLKMAPTKQGENSGSQKQTRAPPPGHRTGGGSKARGKADGKGPTPVAKGPRKQRASEARSRGPTTPQQASRTATRVEPPREDGGSADRQGQTGGTRRGEAPTPVAAVRTEQVPTREAAPSREQPRVPKAKAPLAARAREFLYRKAMWLPRTEENRAALTRALRLFLEAADPECEEDTSWAAGLLEGVWLDDRVEEALGVARPLNWATRAARVSSYADGSTSPAWWNPHRWLARDQRATLDTLSQLAPSRTVVAAIGGAAVVVIAARRWGLNWEGRPSASWVEGAFASLNLR